MGPYDQPCYMTVSICLKHWGKPDFEDAFFAELAENETSLPLEGMCKNGGYPSAEGWATFEDLKIEKLSPEEMEGSFHVSFTEELNTSCKDITLDEKRSGRITFSLRRANGELKFESTQLDQREYDGEEF